MRGEGIKKIDTLLRKYRQTIRAPQASVVEAFRKIVFEMLGIKLRKEQMRYSVSSKTISITATGPMKSEILFHKEKLFTRCIAVLGEKNAPRHIV